MTSKKTSPSKLGAPWIGPVLSRTTYERRFLYVLLAMLGSALTFFGFRALTMVILIVLPAIGTFLLAGLLVRIAKKRWPRAASPLLAMNAALMAALTMPLLYSPQMCIGIGVLIGILVHIVGSAHRLRIHPVALLQVLLLAGGFLVEPPAVESVLTPSNVVFGDAFDFGKRTGGPMWWSMSSGLPNQAIVRADPHQVMLHVQSDILDHEMHLVAIMRRTEQPRIGFEEDMELPRLIDLLIGAVPGPIGATGKLLIIFSGLYLIWERVSRWVTVVVALGAALVAMCLVPVGEGADRMAACGYFLEAGPAISVSYFAYQLLATPLLFICMIMLPMVCPRTARGRFLYAIAVGAGTVVARWWIPYEAGSYLPLVLAGCLMGWMDQLRRSRFVSRANRIQMPREPVIPTTASE